MPNIKMVSGFICGIALASCKTGAPAAPVATPANAQGGAATVAQAAQSLGAAVEPALKPASAAAGALGMSFVVASPMKLVADLDALSKSLQLPVALGQSFLPTLTGGFSPGGVKVARETLDRLDVTRPVAVIWLAQGSGAPAGWCAAIAFKERTAALDALQSIGAGSAQGEGAFERRLLSGDLVWGAVKDRQLLLSGSRETLLAAGVLAIAAQKTPMSGQALFTLSPAVMARSTGQSLDVVLSSVVGGVLAEMEKEASGKGRPLTPARKKMTEALFKALIRPLSQIAVARVSLDIGDRRGVALRAEVQPTPGSGLAAKVAHVSPYAFDPALPVRSDASGVVVQEDEKFFSVDEFGPFSVKIQGGRALTKKGTTRLILQRQRSKGRLIVTGALELSTNQVTHFYSEKKDTEEMTKLLEILLNQHSNQRCLYLSWDAASWHISGKLKERVSEINTAVNAGQSEQPFVKLVPLPASAQFLNVIESVFSGMARAVLHNSDYQSVDECKEAIDKHFANRNETYTRNPRRAGDKIWGKELVEPCFKGSNNCKDPNWR